MPKATYKCMYCGEKPEPGVRSLKRFPLNNEELLRSWLQRLGLMDSGFVPSKHYPHLCSDHFTSDCVPFCDKKLVSGSIPTLFGKRIWKLCVCCGANQYDVVRRSFHSFPSKNTEISQMWMKSIIKATGIVPSMDSLICSEHFEDDCFKNHLRESGKLKISAVPTIFKPAKLREHLVQGKKRPSESEELPSLPPLKYFRLPSTESNNDDQLTSDNRNEKQTPDNFISEQITLDYQNPEDPAVGVTNQIYQMTPRKSTCVQNDHNYNTTPRSLKRKLFAEQTKTKKLNNLVRVRQQQIGRLKKRISRLKYIVARYLPDHLFDLVDESPKYSS